MKSTENKGKTNKRRRRGEKRKITDFMSMSTLNILLDNINMEKKLIYN